MTDRREDFGDKDKDLLIARQALKLAALQEDVEELRERISCATLRIICIGGPLNDNKLHYSKEQLVTFQRILNDLEG